MREQFRGAHASRRFDLRAKVHVNEPANVHANVYANERSRVTRRSSQDERKQDPFEQPKSVKKKCRV